MSFAGSVPVRGVITELNGIPAIDMMKSLASTLEILRQSHARLCNDTFMYVCLLSLTLKYYNRFANHEQSAKLDKALYQKTEKKMEQVQQSSDLSWIEVQFLKSAVGILLDARDTLQWTYCFAYYLKRNNQTELFEDNQRDLEMAVEQLSELLEKPLPDSDGILDLKQAVLNKSVYVTNRREILLEDTAKGLAEHRWVYNVDLSQ